jgi:hypothetical protein
MCDCNCSNPCKNCQKEFYEELDEMYPCNGDIFYCIVDWWSAPTISHDSIDEADEEADRLARKTGKEVRVVKLIGLYTPTMQVNMKPYDLDTYDMDWIEVCSVCKK